MDYIRWPKEKITTIKGFSSLDDATCSDLSFCLGNGEEWLSSIMSSHACVISANFTKENIVDPVNNCYIIATAGYTG